MRSALHTLTAVLPAILLLSSAAAAGDFTSSLSWYWSTTNTVYGASNTWGQGMGNYPGVTYPWSNDTANIESGHTIIMNGYTPWAGEGTPYPTNLTIVLNGGELKWNYIAGVSAAPTLRSWMRVKANSTLTPQSSGGLIAGKISDWDGSTTGNLRLGRTNQLDIGEFGGSATAYGDRSGFSGNWIFSNGLICVGWNCSAIGTGNQVFGSGTLDMDGGTVWFASTPGTIFNPVLVRANGGTIRGDGTYGPIDITLGGPVSGPGELTLSTPDGYITLTNAANSCNGLRKTGGYTATLTRPGAQGTGTVTVVEGTLALDATPDQNWVMTNNLAGRAYIKVENGGSTNTLTAQGSAVSPGTNAVFINTNTTGILTNQGSFAFGKLGSQCAQLNIKIAANNNVAGVDYDRLTATHRISGLSDANLNVSIATNLTPADLAGQVFTILTATNDLAGQCFNSVQWSEAVVSPRGWWHGAVLYGFDSPTGYVRLSNLTVVAKGTIILLR